MSLGGPVVVDEAVPAAAALAGARGVCRTVVALQAHSRSQSALTRQQTPLGGREGQGMYTYIGVAFPAATLYLPGLRGLAPAPVSYCQVPKRRG